MTDHMTYGPYSPVRQAGSHYYISGQIGVDGQTGQAGTSITAQTEQALQNLQSLLTEHGLTMQDVIKTTVFLYDMADFAAMNETYTSFFEAPRPARSCVEVAGLPRVVTQTLLVEIEAVAYKKQSV